jgi:hypothetical protein
MWKPLRLLQLRVLVVTSWVLMWPLNPVTNPNPIYSHSYTSQYKAYKTEVTMAAKDKNGSIRICIFENILVKI